MHALLYFGELLTVSYDGHVERRRIPWVDSRHGFSNRKPTSHSESERISPPPGEILAIDAYDSQVMYGTSDGFWSAPSQGVQPNYTHHSETPTTGIDASFGVAAAAQVDGLAVFPLNSRWLSKAGLRSLSDKRAGAVSSVSWSRRTLIGRASPFDFRLVNADFELADGADDRKHWLFKQLAEEIPVSANGEEGRVCAITDQTICSWDPAEDRTSIFSRADTEWTRTDESELTSLVGAPIADVSERVISVVEVANLRVCELSGAVVAVNESGREMELLDQPATDLRVYPRSKRYQSLLTAVSEEGVHLLNLAEMAAPGRR